MILLKTDHTLYIWDREYMLIMDKCSLLAGPVNIIHTQNVKKHGHYWGLSIRGSRCSTETSCMVFLFPQSSKLAVQSMMTVSIQWEFF